MRLLFVLIALLSAGGCGLDPIAPPAPVTGEADFSSYVAVGTSVSMGVQSAGLVADLQAHSFPAQLALVAGANGGTFTQPLVASPGIPPVMVLQGFSPAGFPVFGVRPGTPPVAPSTPRPADGYDNLGISGATLANALAKFAGDDPTNYFDLVLQGQGTMVRQALAQRPTFVTVELGVNDAVRAVILGSDTFLTPPAEFAAQYAQIMDSLAAGAPEARLAVANVIDVTELPYATAIPLDLTLYLSEVPTVFRLRDASGPLADGARVLLPAAPLVALGYGLPSPAPPLPDSLVLTLPEVTSIRAAVASFNATIAAQAALRGAALADAHGVFRRAHAAGVTVGGTRYTTAYLRGGLFSLDGVHPSSLGQGLYANEFVRAINARFGATIRPVDLAVLQGGSEPVALPTARPGEAWRAADPALLAATRRSLLGE
jgi:lysophospholipase L1-like esterase